MPNGGMSSSIASGTRSGKHFSTRPELVVDGRTLGAWQSPVLPCVGGQLALLPLSTSGAGS
jgi:hypothetical protein